VNFRFAHISDVHLPPLPAATTRQLLNKRLLGYLSWHRKRKHRHRAEVIDALEDALREQKADHICITGDISNLGLAEEFRAADLWMAGLAAPDAISFVPGNHDAYAPASIAAMHQGLEKWLPEEGYPSTTRRNNMLFIGVSSAVATAPLMATGRVGRRQLERLEAILAETSGSDLYRVLLIHHPPKPGVVGRRKHLVDGAALSRVLSRADVDLVLHGHGHRPVAYELEGRDREIPVFGAGSASLGDDEPARTGHYHLFDLTPRALEVTHYQYFPDRGRFWPTGTMTLPRI